MLPATQIDHLLSELCAELGYCLPPAERERLVPAPPPTALAFTRAVFVAEGMDPDYVTKPVFRSVLGTVTRAYERHEPS